MHKYIILLFFFCLGGKLTAQVPDSLSSRQIPGLEEGPVAVDYYFPFVSNDRISFSDTLINGSFYQYDPTRTSQIRSGHLGHIGSATQGIDFSMPHKYGTRVGLDGYQLYTKTSDDVKFYESKKALTDLYYSQGNEQNDHVFRGSVGRSFNNGFGLSIEHTRMIHSLQDSDLPYNQNAFFESQGSKNTNLLVGIAYTPKDKKYNAHLAFIHNEFQQDSHGGIVRDSAAVFEAIAAADNAEDEFSIPLEATGSDLTTRYAIRELKYKHNYKLLSFNDSTSEAGSKIKLNHTATWSWDVFKFSDNGPDAAFYQGFLTDDRGIRLFLETSNFENYAFLSWENAKEQNKGGASFQAGLRHGAFKIKQEFQDSLVNNLYAEGKFEGNFLGLIDLDVFGQIGLLDNAGDFRINAEAALLTNKFGHLSAELVQQRYAPDLIFNQLFLSQELFWQNDFDKPFDSILKFKYELPSFNFSAQLSYFLMDNYTYFDADIMPAQFDGLINLVQLKIRKDIKWGLLRMENEFTLQTSSEDEITNLPRWSSVNSLAIQGKLFNKVMETRFGFDLRINEAYSANAFFPLLSKFYVQNDREVDFYPALDAQLSFKVSTFRFFIKMENITALISEEVFFQVPFYLQKENVIRFGVGWQLYDQHGA